MLDIMLTLKACIALILLTGAITGFLYALARSRENYKPKVDALTGEIQQAEEETKQREEETQKLQDKIRRESEEIVQHDEAIATLRQEIQESEKVRTALDTQNEEIRRNYATTHSMLSTQQERRDQILSEIGGRSVTALLEEQQQQARETEARQELITRQSETLDEAVAQSKKTEAQKEAQEAHRDATKALLSELEQNIAQKRKTLQTLESDIAQKIAALKEESGSWLERIELYKEQLLKLKENR